MKWARRRGRDVRVVVVERDRPTLALARRVAAAYPEVLLVQGSIVNDFKRPAEVPRLRFSVRYQSGYEVYSWTALPSRNVLLPGESLQFSSRLASPPREGDRVEVRFFNRRDLSAELPRGGAM